jgi:hypothetical protein
MAATILPRCCRVCGTTDGLRKDPRSHGGVRRICASCDAEQKRAWYHTPMVKARLMKGEKLVAAKESSNRYYEANRHRRCSACGCYNPKPSCWKCQGLPSNPGPGKGSRGLPLCCTSCQATDGLVINKATGKPRRLCTECAAGMQRMRRIAKRRKQAVTP